MHLYPIACNEQKNPHDAAPGLSNIAHENKNNVKTEAKKKI